MVSLMKTLEEIAQNAASLEPFKNSICIR